MELTREEVLSIISHPEINTYDYISQTNKKIYFNTTPRRGTPNSYHPNEDLVVINDNQVHINRLKKRKSISFFEGEDYIMLLNTFYYGDGIDKVKVIASNWKSNDFIVSYFVEHKSNITGKVIDYSGYSFIINSDKINELRSKDMKPSIKKMITNKPK